MDAFYRYAFNHAIGLMVLLLGSVNIQNRADIYMYDITALFLMGHTQVMHIRQIYQAMHIYQAINLVQEAGI